MPGDEETIKAKILKLADELKRLANDLPESEPEDTGSGLLDLTGEGELGNGIDLSPGDD